MPSNPDHVGRLTAAQTAQRLGVKVPTVYAYVSRGHLRSERSPDGRSSTFDPDEVEQLARRGRPRRTTRAPLLEIDIETAVTDVADGHLRYRGHDAVVLSRTVTFEAVAELLWDGSLPDRATTWQAATDPGSSGRGTDRRPAASEPIRHLDRLRLVTAELAASDPLAGDLHPDAVVDTARRLLSSVAVSLPRTTTRTAPRLRLRLPDTHASRAAEFVVTGSIAQHLAVRLGARAVDGALVQQLNSVLCLLADHELAASTLAARVAASARADPHGVVGAGLGPFSGSLHGTASRHVRTLFDDATRHGPSRAVADAIRVHGRLPGFGHPLYPHGDPRAAELLRQLRSRHDPAALTVVEQVLTLAAERSRLQPNIDAALGALGHVAGLDHDAGEALFGIARMAGWIAHALEEYRERPLRFRPRARYVGAPPQDDAHPA